MNITSATRAYDRFLDKPFSKEKYARSCDWRRENGVLSSFVKGKLQDLNGFSQRKATQKIGVRPATLLDDAAGHFHVGRLNEEKGDIPSAVQSYQRALAMPPFFAEARKAQSLAQDAMDRIFINLAGVKGAVVANNIGAMYHAADRDQLSCLNALKWYQRAIVLDPRLAVAYSNIGLLHEEDLISDRIYYDGPLIDFPNNPVEAARSFRRAIDLGFQKAERYLQRLRQPSPTISSRERTIIERENLTWQRQKGGKISEDTEIKIALKAPANKRLYGQAVRIMLSGNHPFSLIDPYLSPAEREKIGKLARQINRLVVNLSKSAPATLCSSIQPRMGKGPSPITQDILEDLYTLDLIKPIMNLAKLAIFGCHRLSGQNKYTFEDYDNDNYLAQDDLMDSQKLQINIDPNYGSLGRICSDPPAPSSMGVYFQGSNEICVAGLNSNVYSTLIHELTHFAANEVFGNNCLPYKADDVKHASEFGRITTKVRDRAQAPRPHNRDEALDKTIEVIFGDFYSSLSHSPDVVDMHQQIELIVRVPEILTTHAVNALVAEKAKSGVTEQDMRNAVARSAAEGLQRLETQIPDVLRYYRAFFLPAIAAHVQVCEKIAMGS